MGLAKTAVADASITFLWVFCMASLGAVSTMLAPSLGMDGPGNGKLYIVFGLVSFLIFLFSALGQALGGASWNPTALVAFAYAGVSKDSLFSLGVRLPAQVSPTPESSFLCDDVLFLVFAVQFGKKSPWEIFVPPEHYGTRRGFGIAGLPTPGRILCFDPPYIIMKPFLIGNKVV